MLLILMVLGSTAAQDAMHPEWCAGAGTRGDGGERCPELRTEATPCPAGCAVKIQTCETCGTQSTMVAVAGTIVVLAAFIFGVVHPIMSGGKGPDDSDQADE